MSSIVIKMQSNANWNEEKKARSLVQILTKNQGFLPPAKYDDHEPLKHAFDELDFGRLLSFWSKGFVLFKRQKPYPMWLMVQIWPLELSICNEVSASIDVRYLNNVEGVEFVLQFAEDLYRWGEVIHGYVCHEEEWNTKNYFGVPTKVASGLCVSTGGLRIRDGLPGIYWANFFSPLYVEFLGKQKFNSIDAFRVTELNDGGVLIVVSPTPCEYARPDINEEARRLMIHLGKNAFFEKEHPMKICSVPDLLLTLPTPYRAPRLT